LTSLFDVDPSLKADGYISKSSSLFLSPSSNGSFFIYWNDPFLLSSKESVFLLFIDPFFEDSRSLDMHSSDQSFFLA